MFTYIIKVTICWLGFYLIYSAFLKKETFFSINRWYLLATLLLGAGIPLLEFLPIFQEDSAAVVYMQPLSESVYYVQTAVNEAVTQSSFGWVQLFWSVYLLGVAILGIRFFIGLGEIWKLYSGAEVLQKENHTLVITKELHLPFSFFKLLFWSKDFELNDVDGQKIVTHEEAHVKGWHSVDVLLCEIISIIFWCSPMVYFYKKSLKTVHEYLADAVVLQTTPTKKYGHLLLKQSQSGLQVALANHFFHSQLKQRIIMMTKSKSRKEAIIKYLFTLPVILLLVILFSKKEAIANTENEPIKIVQEDKYDNFNSIADIENYIGNDVDEMPLFPGCEEAADKKQQRLCSNKKMLHYIYSNIKYPKAAAKEGIQGKVIIKFVVKKDGTISNARIAQDIGGGCGEEALKVINGLPKMTPGQKDGKTVDVEMLIPVSFKLADEDDSDTKASLIEYLKKDNVKFIIDGEKALKSDVKKLITKGMPHFEVATVNKKKDEKTYSFDVVIINTKKSLTENESTSSRFGELYPNEKNVFYLDGKIISEKEAYSFSEEKIATINIRRIEKVGKLGNHIIIHSKDYLKKELTITSNENESKSSNEPIFNQVDEMPRFAGCEDQTDKDARKSCAENKMLTYIYSNIKYPKAAAKADVQGRVIAQFVIQKDGSIADVNILRGIGGGCDEETKRVLESMPNWIPGKQEGEAVNVKFTMPIVFKLTGERKKETAKEDSEINTRTHPIEKKNALTAAGLNYVKVSPNPTNGMIDIEYGSQDKPMSITIVDVNGKEIYRKDVVGGRSSLRNVNVKNAAKGLLLVTFQQDGKTYTEKVILQ